MKRYLIASAVVIFFFLAGWVTIQRNKIQKLRGDLDLKNRNIEVLTGSVNHYETAAGKKAAEVYALNLTIKELQRYRAADAETIKQLNTRRRDVEAVTGTGTETIVRVEVPVRDSVVFYRDRVDTVKCVSYRTAWTDINGCVRDGVFDVSVKIRDSLLVVETVKLKRFLGFLWKTRKVLDRKVDVTARNPDTIIKDVQFVKVRR